jgi:hypothetical protein
VPFPADLSGLKKAALRQVEQVCSSCLIGHVVAYAVRFDYVSMVWVPQRVADKRALPVVQHDDSPQLTFEHLELLGLSRDRVPRIRARTSIAPQR